VTKRDVLHVDQQLFLRCGFQEGMFRWDVSLRIRRDAVALCRAAGGTRTHAAVAAELGITGETLRSWVRKDTAQLAPERREAGTGQSPADEPARLRAENARLLKAERGWQLEREILRRAATYVAREVKSGPAAGTSSPTTAPTSAPSGRAGCWVSLAPATTGTWPPRKCAPSAG
jgi:transposase